MSDTKPISIILLGSTGLTGSATLRALLSSPVHPFRISTFTRTAPPPTPARLASTSHTTRTFSDLIEAVNEHLAERGAVYVSCLGTTREAAGGFEQQKKVDVDLNRALARKAREDGAGMAILVSAGKADSSSMFGYMAMKGEMEDALIGMEFDKTVILRPGLLMGRTESRFAESMAQKVYLLGKLGLSMAGLMTEGQEVGDCIAYFATHPPVEKVKIVENDEIKEAAKLWRAACEEKAYCGA